MVQHIPTMKSEETRERKMRKKLPEGHTFERLTIQQQQKTL